MLPIRLVADEVFKAFNFNWIEQSECGVYEKKHKESQEKFARIYEQSFKLTRRSFVMFETIIQQSDGKY